MIDRSFLSSLGSGLRCFKCSLETDCDNDHTGPLVSCQTTDPELENYGNACMVSHSGKEESIPYFNILSR